MLNPKKKKKKSLLRRNKKKKEKCKIELSCLSSKAKGKINRFLRR